MLTVVYLNSILVFGGVYYGRKKGECFKGDIKLCWQL